MKVSIEDSTAWETIKHLELLHALYSIRATRRDLPEHYRDHYNSMAGSIELLIMDYKLAIGIAAGTIEDLTKEQEENT